MKKLLVIFISINLCIVNVFAVGNADTANVTIKNLPIYPQLLLPIPLSLLPQNSVVPNYGEYTLSTSPPQNLDCFYQNFEATKAQMFRHETWVEVLGVASVAFCWGMVVKQAIEYSPSALPPMPKK
ncbi:hypothetical protein FACS189452_01970 [Bacteroidia bacterium]|nr:hypothetical protein FACS189452_01970 [Bacteroidia bacterium]